MENIELVIKIPKELYEAYKGRPPMLGDAGMDMITQSIANGIPLEQQSCDDAISRADVFEFLKGFEILHNHDELRSNLIYGIMNLPSVTPKAESEV